MKISGLENINIEVLEKILDHSSDEIYVFNKHKRVIYVNKMCENHYGIKPEDIIGQSNDELLAKGYWTPSIVPIIFKEKKNMILKQTTYIGAELITTAVPILNEENEVELVVCTSKQIDYRKVEMKNEEIETKNHTSLPSIVTNNDKMREIISFCHKIAAVDTTVLIHGESGTGKGVIAKYIHHSSKRQNKPFVNINCAAIPEELLEAELFGYVGGAFTGADKQGKKGLFEVANTGTIFLDEIGEISPKIQAKLLHVIQDQTFLPVGGREHRKVNIRIIAATNRSLSNMVERNEFREDLYYRLNVIDIKLPPLRERKEDILPLTYYFLNKFNKKYDVTKLLSQEVTNIIQSYSWPGNVRQLENVMERLVVIGDEIIMPASLPEIIVNSVPSTNVPDFYPHSLDEAIEEVKRKLIIQSFEKHKSTRKVAKELSISQSRASQLIRKYNLQK